MVLPGDGESVIIKNFPNSFRETRLKDLLEQHSIEEVMIVGPMSHMCVDAGVSAANDSLNHVESRHRERVDSLSLLSGSWKFLSEEEIKLIIHYDEGRATQMTSYV